MLWLSNYDQTLLLHCFIGIFHLKIINNITYFNKKIGEHNFSLFLKPLLWKFNQTLWLVTTSSTSILKQGNETKASQLFRYNDYEFNYRILTIIWNNLIIQDLRKSPFQFISDHLMKICNISKIKQMFSFQDLLWWF